MNDVSHVARLPPHPFLIFDGTCGFCRLWIARWRQITGDTVEYLPYQDPQVPDLFPELDLAACARAVHFVDVDGRVSRGARAVFESLDHRTVGRGHLKWTYEHLPGFAWASEAAYRLVADHRNAAGRVTALAWGPSVERQGMMRTRALFLRLLGVVYFLAFLSLWVQVDGLIGSRGILPAAEYMAGARAWANEQRLGVDAFRLLPTLTWWSAGDGFLHALCAGGAAAALLLAGGVAPAATTFLLWLDYLSLSVVSRDFLSFQWDALLLETGLLAVFLSPWSLTLSRARSAPSRVVVGLLKWLLFRLMFSSGVVKLASGDPSWRDLTALTYHYETQPLPTWIGWYAHQLPLWFQKLSATTMFTIELAVPFLIFAPRRLRLVAAGAFVAFQALIAATGNYCFFGLLTIVLCVALLDDSALRAATPGWLRAREESPADVVDRGRWPRWIIGAITAVVLIASSIELGWAFRTDLPWPSPLVAVFRLVAPFRSVNGYGLFMVMTKSRPEIVIEGSNDGLTWRAYEFRYKPGDLSRRPAFVAPHQPRLDWQMWFAALGSWEDNPWLQRFCQRLLSGSPPVLGLLAVNPFPEQPPQQLRAMLYVYRFSNAEERRRTGQWWHRELREQYSPVLSRSSLIP